VPFYFAVGLLGAAMTPTLARSHLSLVLEGGLVEDAVGPDPEVVVAERVEVEPAVADDDDLAVPPRRT
jgi:hypothetical protein